MIIILLLPCFTIMVSAVPVRPNVLPPLLLQGGGTQDESVQPAEATNQKPDTQTPAPLSPKVEQPQSGVSQQLGPQGIPQFLPPTQHYTWSTLGGSPMFIPLQPNIYGSQPANLPALRQQPLIFPSYRYIHLVSSSIGNQLFSPFGFPMILASPLAQTPAIQPPNSLVLPAQTPAAPSGNAPQSIQQQQSPQIIYMLQQPMNSALGSLSSEELERAAEMGQLGVYLPTVLTNPSTGAVQPVNQATGLTNPERGIMPTVGTMSAGLAQTQGPASSGPQPNMNMVSVGLGKPTQEAATVQTPVEPKHQPHTGKPCLRQQAPAETTHNILRKT